MRRKSTLERNFNFNIAKVWEVVTDNSDYSWRTDLEKIEIKNQNNFIEIYKTGGKTEFEVIEKTEYKTYSFQMRNKFFYGGWNGEFIEINPDETKLIFTENLKFSNFFIYIVSFFAINLKKMQKDYFDDLERRLQNDD